MNTNQYTQKTLEALQAAQQLAVEYQHNALEPEHLLHALASQEQGLIPQLLQKLNVDPGSFAAAVAEKLSALPRVSGSGRDPDKVYISQATDKVLSAAAREAKAMKDEYVSVEHVFLGLLDEPTQNTTELFRHRQGQVSAAAYRRARQPARDHGQPRGHLQRPAEIRSGSGGSGPQAEAGPGHRP